ncbi:MAG: hypothetical protein P8185_21925, partial [Deltaproteobacteria bacterium]
DEFSDRDLQSITPDEILSFLTGSPKAPNKSPNATAYGNKSRIKGLKLNSGYSQSLTMLLE